MTNMSDIDPKSMKIGAVIPCYRAADSIAAVVADIPDVVDQIFCVNDASDDNLGDVLNELAKTNPRVQVLTHETNQGVGGATVTGYKAAIDADMHVIVKLDSDGQMDPTLIPALVAPILKGEADYVKGNRFFNLESVRAMPNVRLLGNAGLSFMSKISSGYWHLFDPTNGFTAIHAEVARVLPLDKLHKRYFFESDLLFRLGTLPASVTDVPMEAIYGEEVSNLSEFDALARFPVLHTKNFFKRLAYNFFLRDFSTASLYFVMGTVLLIFGLIFGIGAWISSAQSGAPATAGTVMLSALPILIGIQMLLTFFGYDVASSRRPAIHPHIGRVRVLKARAASTKSLENQTTAKSKARAPKAKQR